MSLVRVDLLGPVTVHDDDREIDLGGARNRALVARLALDVGRSVGVDALVDALWGLDVPQDAHNALQSIVSRTRRRLPAGVVARTDAGYRLALDPDRVDAHRFEDLSRAGAFAEALALWQGPALADVREMPFADAAATRLDQLRLGVLESRIEVDLADPAVDAAGLTAELEELTRAYPFREQLWARLMRLYVATDRTADALAAYESVRAELSDTMGIDPSPPLQELHLSILRADPALARSRRAERSTPTNLRAALTSFVGREEALDEVMVLTASHRLTTIVGPGGAGKTRLAVEAAGRLRDGHPDGVWLVELAPVTAESDVLDAVVGALGLRELVVLDRPGPRVRVDAHARLVEALADKEILLVVDNCEHLVEGVAAFVDDVLARASRLRILATSREPLNLVGEVVLNVPALTTPRDDCPPKDALGYSAVELFAERAAAAAPGFEVDERTVAPVIEICRRLDGQPLAIELAAARLRTLGVDQIARRLGDRFRLLTGGSRTALARHRTLRAVVEWSWDLLTDAERALAEVIAVFPAGVTPSSAAAVVEGATSEDLLGGLSELADKSLLVPVLDQGERDLEPRFRMLETLREYGTERLVESGRLESARRDHLAYFLALVERSEPMLRGPDQLDGLAVLDVEWDNVVAALRFAIDRSDADAATRMVAAVAWYLSLRSQHEEAGRWAEAALAVDGERPPEAELTCSALLIVISMVEADRASRVPPLERRITELGGHVDDTHPVIALILTALELFTHETPAEVRPTTLDHPDPWARAAARFMTVAWLDNAGRAGEGDLLLQEALDGFRAVGDRWGMAMCLSQVAMRSETTGDSDRSLSTLEEAVVLMNEVGAYDDAQQLWGRLVTMRVRNLDRPDADGLREDLSKMHRRAQERGSTENEIIALMGLAQLERTLGDDKAAEEHLRRAVRIVEEPGRFGQQLSALLLSTYAMVLLARDAEDDARRSLVDAGDRARITKDMPVVAGVAVAYADLARHQGDPELAARRLGASVSIRGGEDHSNVDAHRIADELRVVMGAGSFDARYDEGRAMTRDEALELGCPSASSV